MTGLREHAGDSAAADARTPTISTHSKPWETPPNGRCGSTTAKEMGSSTFAQRIAAAPIDGFEKPPPFALWQQIGCLVKILADLGNFVIAALPYVLGFALGLPPGYPLWVFGVL